MKARRIKTVIIVILVIANLIAWGMAIYPRFSHKLEVRYYEETQLEVVEVEQTLSHKQAKAKIRKLMKTPHLYFEIDIKEEGLNGRAIMMLRTVQIDKGLSIHDYIITYTHELIHLKKLTGNETYCSYMTFVHLYESGDAELRYHALIYANDVLGGEFKGTDYDCGYYILEYLEVANGR